MAFQRTVKLLAALSLSLGMAACSTAPATEEQEPIKVLAPTGAPALSTLGLSELEYVSVDYVEGQDSLISELAKTDGEYDLIIAPINVGIKTWNASQAYELDGVVTWGNLYLVGDQADWNVEGNTIAAFGESAVPGLVFNELYPELNCDVTYYPSVAEASQALIAGQVSTALLAQPVAAVAINKSAEAGRDVSIQADLQQEWQTSKDTEQKGYPQAALFVKAGEQEKTKGAVAALADFLSEPTDEQITARIDQIGAETLGIPSAQIAVKTWKAQNIHYKKASECTEDIKNFLAVFDMELPESIVAE